MQRILVDSLLWNCLSGTGFGIGDAKESKTDSFPLRGLLSGGGKTNGIICEFAPFVRCKMKIWGSCLKVTEIFNI